MKKKTPKLLYSIRFRLFWDDKPVGFQSWDYMMGDSYTYGEPERVDGWYPYGWSGTKIAHNRKEIIEIKYVDQEFLENQKKYQEFWQETFAHINKNLPIINYFRQEQGLEPLTKVL